MFDEDDNARLQRLEKSVQTLSAVMGKLLPIIGENYNTHIACIATLAETDANHTRIISHLTERSYPQGNRDLKAVIKNLEFQTKQMLEQVTKLKMTLPLLPPLPLPPLPDQNPPGR